MKNLIIIIYLFQVNSILIAQPSDYQWYIWDNKYGSKVSQNHTIPLDSNTIQINNVSHPGPDTMISGTQKNTKNDLFIIFNNGDYFNSRGGNPEDCFSKCPIPSWNYKLDLQDDYVPIGESSHKSNKIKYLYYSNIYEGDDPPSTVSISQSASPSPLIYSLTATSYNQNFNTLSANHDVVKGADYTLIIPNLWESCPIISIKYAQDLFIFDTLLNPIGSASVSHYSNPGNLRISNPFDGNAFNFINFHTASNSKYLLDTCILEVGCFRNATDTMQNIKFKTETIAAAHDPNYIEVRCISKEIFPKLWPFGPKKVKVSYHIECYNDGIGDADVVSLAFTLPAIANPSKVWINSWKCGNTNGCNRNTGPNPLIWNQTGQAVIINFTNGKLKGISSPFSERQAYVDFCVELNTTDLESVLNWDTNLQITNASTKFDSAIYPITRFIDPKKENINQNDRTTNKSSCFCGCKSKKK